MIDGIAPWLEKSQWPTVPIRLVARLGTGHTPSRTNSEYWQDCTIPWITLADVWQLRSGTTSVIIDTKEKISRTGLANSAAVVHAAGTVILSRTASVGFSAIMGSDMATSQDFATWTCGPRLEPRYLLHALRGMTPDLKRVATGSTHKTIYMPDIEQLRIPLPPFHEQLRIADFLDKETTRIELIATARKAQFNCLASLWEAQLAERADELAQTYGTIPLRRISWSIEQGWSPQCEDAEASPDEWAVLKTSAVSSGKFMPLEHKRLPISLQPNLRYRVSDGDILLTRGSGSPTHVGIAALARTNGRKLLLSDLLYRVRINPNWHPEYVTLLLGSAPVRGATALLMRGQSGQTIKLRAEDIRSIAIPAATPAVQIDTADQFNRFDVQISAARAAIGSSLQLLDERKRALITAAVTGQFDVSTASGRGVVA